jgi:diaminopimelate dehydrogenase
MADQKIRIGIVGYGNLGKGVELAIRQNDDMELVGVFTRRDPEQLQLATPDIKKYRVEDAENMRDQIDVMILCGGSATDLAVQGPQFAAHFNTVDSFDTHAKIPEYFDSMDQTAKKSGKVAAISVGWDPGMFSINRMYGDAILPQGKTYTFWGKGVSQGHSDAIRRVKGVKNGIQYTIPIEEAVNRVRHGEDPELSIREKHLRECFVVAEEGADKKAIEAEIKNMPNYFSDYDTVVHFITEEQLKADHSAMPHGGFVIRSGKTGENQSTKHIVEYSLKLESNPEFTSSVLVAYARAVYKLHQKGETGARTVLDIAPAMLSPKSGAQLRKELL